MMKSTLLLLAMLPALFLHSQEVPPAKKPEICFDTRKIDFGKIEWGSPGVFTFNFTNCGTDVLIIQNGQTSCGCLICDWPKEPVYPGKTAVVRLKYDTRRAGPTVKSATITSNAAGDPVVVLTIKGTVLPTPMAVIADSTIDFGTVTTGEKLHFGLTNQGAGYSMYRENENLEIVKIEQVSGTPADLVPTSTILEKGAAAQLEFSIREQKKGTFSKSWKVYFNDGRDPVLLTATGKFRR